MNFKLFEEGDDNERNSANKMDTDRDNSTVHTPAPDGTEREVEVEKALPGPACSKQRRSTRVRSGSVSSNSSSRSSASAAPLAGKKKRVRGRTESYAAATAGNQGGERASSPINIESDGSEKGSRSPGDNEPPAKRRLAETEDRGAYSDDATIRGRGRPQTTGLYVERAKAQEKCNRLKKEEVELEEAKALRRLTVSELFSKLERDLEAAVEEMENSSTADVANRARECMAEVVKVARISKNLQGGCVKSLKHSAVVAAASAEVLRTRADKSETGSDAYRQVKALRRELDGVKREMQTARKEAEALRKELAAERAMRKRRSGGRGKARIVDDDDDDEDSPSRPPNWARVEDHETAEKAARKSPPKEDAQRMDVEEKTGAEAPASDEYDDERRRREIMPPPSEYPPAIRPAIRGRIKVLEDRPLKGPKVKLATNRGGKATCEKAERGQRSEVQSFMDQITPLLDGWFREKLLSTGLPNRTEEGGETEKRPAGKAPKGEKRRTELTPHGKDKPEDAGIKKGGQSATTVPNSELFGGGWTAAQGRSAEVSEHPTPSRGAQERLGEWTVAEGRRRRKKKPPPLATRTPVGAEQGGRRPPAQKGKDPRKSGPPKQRPPRTAAVTLTCPQGNYADAMRVARERIDLKEIGIQSLRPKRAVTGAIVLEVPGPNGAERAETLKEKMATALSGMEGVRVARPVKQGEARVKEILISTSAQEIKRAISATGGCREEELQTGEIRVGPRGMGTLWVRGPLAVINKIVAIGRLETGGWSSPKVEALEPRRLQCFKCLEMGHVQGVCPSEADRRDLCYRCGQGGHRARDCSGAPRCVICEEAGRHSSHRMGGKACRMPRGKNAGLPGRARPPANKRGEKEGLAPAAASVAPPQARGAHALERGEERGEPRPAVRGGPPHQMGGGTPVPVRPGQDTEEQMEVEDGGDPAPPLPPLEQRPPRGEKGVEAPGSAEPSSLR